MPEVTPLWVWAFAIIGPVGITLLLLLTIVATRSQGKPLKRIELDECTIELWARERKLPCNAGALIVPVASDLKMAAGIAKWAKDKTANAVQYEADSAAPLQPGQAFVGSGAKFSFNLTGLAVVMDDQKRTKPEWIASAIKRAMEVARERDADTCIIADMTNDLLQQPSWPTDEDRRNACLPIARATLDGIIQSNGAMENVVIWVWQKGVEEIYLEELNRLDARLEIGAAA